MEAVLVILFFVGFFVLLGFILKKIEDIPKKKKSDFELAVRNTLESKQFHIDKQYKTTYGILSFDLQHRYGAYIHFSNIEKYDQTPLTNLRYFPLGKITSCGLVQDGSMVHQNAVVPGMVGAALFGLGGALAGATAMNRSEQCGHLSVRVLINDPSISSLTVPTLNYSVRKSHEAYTLAFNTAQEIYNEFEGIIHYNRAQQSAMPTPIQAEVATPVPATHVQQNAHEDIPAQGSIEVNSQILDQLKRIAQMHTEGILTDEEFTSKKKALLEKMV